MAKLVLIHGNAVGIKFFIRDRRTKYGSFKAFEKLIDNEQAVLHGWHYINEDFSFWRTINPWEFRQQYFIEKHYCNSEASFKQLESFLDLHQPEQIVCHSMGCYLLLNSINFQGICKSVSQIYLAQGDFKHDFQITHPETLDRLHSGKLKLYNYYCYWDQALVSSIIANSQIPAGLIGAKENYFINKIFPHLSSVNLHHGTICSQKFLEEVISRKN